MAFSLDVIGITSFGHNFGALRGQKSPVLAALENFSKKEPSGIPRLLHYLQFFFPFYVRLPTGRNKDFARLSESLDEIFETLMARKKNEMQGLGSGEQVDLSAIGTLGEDFSRCLTYSLIVSPKKSSLVLVKGWTRRWK